MTPNRRRVWLLVLLLLSTGLSLSRFNQSLWLDEAMGVWFTHRPLPDLLIKLCDPHPAGYYLLLKGWRQFGGDEFWLRWPSLLTSIFAVAVTYRLGREWCGSRCAWLAVLLLTGHPLQIWYAGQARMYIPAQAVGLLVVWLGRRLLTETKPQPWRGRATVYSLVALAAFGIDYTVILPFGLLQLLWLARGRPRFLSWLVVQSGVLLLAGGLWLTSGQRWALGHGYQAVFVAVQANRLGFAVTPEDARQGLQVILLGLVAAAGLIAWFWSRDLKRLKHRPWLAGAIIGGWLLLLLLAAFPRAFTVKRQIVVLLPYLALATAYSLKQFPWPTGAAVAGVGLTVTLVVLTSHPHEPWRWAVAHLIEAGSAPETVVWVDELAAPSVDYYLRRDSPEAGPIRWSPLGGQTLPDLAPRPGQTLWIITAESIYRRPAALLPAAFQRNYRLFAVYRAQGLGLYRYRRLENPLPVGAVEPASLDPTARWGVLLPSPLTTCQTQKTQ